MNFVVATQERYLLVNDALYVWCIATAFETLREKQLLIVEYCLELGYDLMIHPDNNVYRMLEGLDTVSVQKRLSE